MTGPVDGVRTALPTGPAAGRSAGPVSRRPAGVDYDVVVLGGGYRATSFLASAAASPAWAQIGRVAVLEAGDRVGPGAFARYGVTSSSAGSRLLQAIPRGAPFGPLWSDPQTAAVLTATGPVPLTDCAAVLGQAAELLLDAGRVAAHTRRPITAVDVHGAGDARAGAGRVSVRTSAGEVISCRHLVLATGRTERPHPQLAPWQARVWLSEQVISLPQRPELLRRLRELNGRRVVIAGCSHSAMSALRVLLDAGEELAAADPAFQRPAIDLLRRGPARLMYPSARDARREQVPGRELLFDPQRHVCPVTGVVFRDTGLRHSSRDLYCAVWAGALPGVTVHAVTDLDDAAADLEQAGLIVQALGYRGRAPDIAVDGTVVHQAGSTDRLYADDTGAALIAGRPLPEVSVLRLEPTPPERRDNAAYGRGLYAHVVHRVLTATAGRA